MSIDLSPFSSIGSALFVEMDIPDFQTIRYSDYYRDYTIGGNNYNALGQLLSVGNTQSDLSLTDSELTIAISGVPTANITGVLEEKIKGSRVTIYRGIFDPETGTLYGVSGNPALKFKGIITNFSLSEEVDQVSRTSSTSIIFTCSSVVTLMRNKLSGRRTNPTDQKRFYPNDLSMDRVPNISDSNFNFGAPK
jgi:hypothetical protein